MRNRILACRSLFGKLALIWVIGIIWMGMPGAAWSFAGETAESPKPAELTHEPINTASKGTHPNIILINTDDLGYGISNDFSIC